MDFVPEVSAIRTDTIEVDKETMEMLKSIGLSNLPGVQLQQPQQSGGRDYGRKN